MMDGECSESNSSNMAKKLCVTRPDEGVDRISKLPDELIILILSFLPLKESAAASVLSSRWSELWKHTHNLEFGFQSEAEMLKSRRKKRSWNVESCKFIQLVNTVIQSHKSLSLKKFRIYYYVNKSAKSAVTKCLDLLLSRKVEELELDFLYSNNKYRKYRVVLELEELLREKRICRADVILFKSLENLCLKGVKLSGEDIEVFLRNCPLLKWLTINSCTLMSDVEVCSRYDIMLTHLDIQQCSGGKSIKVSGPHLFWIRVDQKSGKLSIGNVPKLKKLGFRVGNRKYVAQHFASAVSCFFSQLKFLYLTLSYRKEFMANGFPQMPNVKELVVKDYGKYEHGGLLPLTAFIWACPRLRIFKLKFPGDLKDVTSDMEVITNGERSPHQHLKIFEFQGVSQSISDRIVELMTYISDNCVALQKIYIGCPLPRKVEVQAGRDCLKQKLHGKLPHRIQLQFF